MSIDTVVRIAFAMLFLFAIVPALARQRRPEATSLEWFFWNFGVGIALITISGQLLTLGSLFSLFTVLLLAALAILLGQSQVRGCSPRALLRQSYESTVVASLNLVEGRVHVGRRIRRGVRRAMASLRRKTSSRSAKLQIGGWITLTVIAAGLRLYRPLASANLGFSDTYVHLYLLKLLEEGKQVDPAWGPYPRGLHFLLLAIHDLTNADQILLLNFFGAFVGVLMTLGVADAARRLSKSLVAGLVAGFLFATMVGGPGQYFLLGGAFATTDESLARTLGGLPYREVAGRGEFDIALTAFHRQTSTLPQELALALLFPAAMFLLDFFRKGDRWSLVGFAGCTAAIAAVHTGVLLPLVLMSLLMLAALALERSLTRGAFRKALVWGTVAVLAGSAWILAFIAYPSTNGRSPISSESFFGNALIYYFPLLGRLAGSEAARAFGDDGRMFVTLTPALAVCIVFSILLVISSFTRRDELRANRLWLSSVFLLFMLMHFASMLRLPQIVEMARNSQWLAMAMAILTGVAIVEMKPLLRFVTEARVAKASAVALTVLLLGWASRVPRMNDPVVHDRIVNYSGYGASALAVLRIERSLEPFTWTIVSYGQEFPMVLHRGFHIPAADFLERYDPTTRVTPIPTRHIFVIVEKTPHQFQINAWAQRFSRSDLEQRLQTWVHLYQATHGNISVFLDDESVRVYQIENTAEEVESMTRRVGQ